jgi:hypothetical protein
MSLFNITAGLAAGAAALLAGVAFRDWRHRRAPLKPGTVPGDSKPVTPTMTTAPARPGTQERGRVYVERSTLHGPVGPPVVLTDTDMLWLARALYGEAGTGASQEHYAAIVWALAQNMKLVRRPRLFTTFTAITRAYCQPVNPKWESLQSSGCVRRPDHCTEAHLARRRRIRTLQWSNIPANIRQVVDSFRAGTLSNPVPGLTDWKAGRWEGATVNMQGNWFGVGQGRRLA